MAPLLRRRSIPPSPEAGEHDDFVRGTASAPPRPTAEQRHPWIGLVSVLVLVALFVATFVLVRARWTPIPDEHVLPTNR